MIKIAQISDSGNVENIFSISEKQRHRMHDFIKNDLKMHGIFIEINEQNSKNFECGVGFFYSKEKNFFSHEKPKPWFIFDNFQKKWICPNNLDLETGKQKDENDLIYEKILNKIPENIVYLRKE